MTPPQPWLDGIAVKKGVIRQDDGSVPVGPVTKLWNALGEAVGIRDGKW